MSAEFYIQTEQGQEVGPMPFDELLASALLGELTEDTLVRSAGSTLWVSACHVKGLFRDAAAERPSRSGQPQSQPQSQPTGTSAAAQAAWEAQLVALQSGGGGLSTGGDQRTKAAWWQGDVGWEVWLGVALILAAIVYLVWVPALDVRFPQPERMAGNAAAGHDFFGTGPWATLDYVLLWFDAVLIVAALLFGRRVLRRW